MPSFPAPPPLLESGDGGDAPSLLFGPDERDALRSRLGREPFRAMFRRLIADAETDDRAAPGTTATGAGEYGEATAAHRCAFLYCLTGDDSWARKARTYTEARLADRQWADPTLKGLTLYYVGKSIALAQDWCGGAPSWDAAFRATVAARLRTQADVIFDNGGTEQNNNPASNWQALRYSSAGLCYLALKPSDAPPDAAERIAECWRRVVLYLRENGGDSPQSRGWNIEGLGYTYYPMGNGVCPFAVAVQRRYPDRDVRREVAAARLTLWTCYATLVRTREGLAHPDFGDDNPSADAEGTLGFAFWFCPPPLWPGLRYWYDRTVGDGPGGDKTFDHGRFGTIASLLYYPDQTAPRDPMSLPAWRTLFADTGGCGYFTFRSAYRDENDLVAQLYAKLRGNKGHNGPDALSFRILGRGTFWAVGGGRYGVQVGGQDAYLRSMNTLYPGDPDGPLTITRQPGRVVGTPILDPSGGGSVTCATDLNNLGVARHTRRFLADYGRRSGAAGVYVVCDTSDNGRFWQLCTRADNAILVTSPTTFLVCSPTGDTLQGTVLYTAGPPRLTTGTRLRGSNAGRWDKNNFVHLRSADGGFLVVLTIAAKNRRHPPVEFQGRGGNGGGGPQGTLRVGDLRVALTQESLRVI